MNVIGYLDELSYRPGDVVRGRFSTTADTLTAGLVRLNLGDTHPLGPGPDVHAVPSPLDGLTIPGREQPLPLGSCVITEEALLPVPTTRLVLHAAVRPTLLRAGHRQTVLSLTQDGAPVVEVALDQAGHLTLGTAESGGESTAPPLLPGEWYRLILEVDMSAGIAAVDLQSADETRGRATAGLELSATRGIGVVFGASLTVDGGHVDHFNGRIDAPVLLADDRVVAAWDFGPTRVLRTVRNTAGEGFSGRAVNMPLRACLGIAGAAEDVDPRLAPEAYSAVHLHDDDLDDAGWAEDLSLQLPGDLPSGVYGIRVRAEDGTEDTVPFVVVPTVPTAAVLVVLPTLSYLAYSCEKVMADPGAQDYAAAVGIADAPLFGGNRHDDYLVQQRLHSLYDVHSDGSGVCFASTRKPLPNIRADHRWAAVAGGATAAHQFSADLHLVRWLQLQGIAFDVVTDLEVHRHGLSQLSPYRVVLTGSHPEYPTTPMLTAFRDYTESGGRFMYLGGNGFYWVTALDPEEGHTMEIRRTAGIRAWEPEAGEWHLTTTGELGGLWRHRGRAPQQWLGVGMAAQGFDVNRPYTVTADPADPRVAFAFAGVEVASGTIGDFPSMVNGHGAAGVEIDRTDRALGTPPDTLVLATATGFSRAYGVDPVDVCLPDGRYDGTTSDKVRCDLVLVPKQHGGAVFSTGSIAWCGSLLVDDGENDVSQLTGNVLRAFLSDGPLPFHRRESP